MVAAIMLSVFMLFVFIAIIGMAADMGVFKPLTQGGSKKTKLLKLKIAQLEQANRVLRIENKELQTKLTAHELELPWVDVPKEEQ